LDQILHGGFARGDVHLLQGSAGTGIGSAFGMTILYLVRCLHL
jgi:hypothetical protein